jgi:hypothetical protein
MVSQRLLTADLHVLVQASDTNDGVFSKLTDESLYSGACELRVCTWC